MSSTRRHELLVFNRTLFFGMNLWTRPNFFNIFALASILTLLFDSRSFPLLNLIGISSVNRECHALFLTSNSVSIKVILFPFIVVNLIMGSRAENYEPPYRWFRE